MKISTRRVDKATIFDISGDIDMSNSPELRRALLHEIRDARASRVVLNLSGVEYVDSSGVASLVEGLKASRDMGSSLVLFGLSDSTREVLQLSRLLKVFEVRDNEEQALTS
jgi:anti-sigma B factor antagonist